MSVKGHRRSFKTMKAKTNLRKIFVRAKAGFGRTDQIVYIPKKVMVFRP
jgi:hypothetical protein